MNILFKEKLQAFYEQDYSGGIEVNDYRSEKLENPIDFTSKRSSKLDIKETIINYIEVLEEMEKTRETFMELENKKKELEKELLNNSISKQVIKELNSAKLKKVNKN